MSIDSMLKAAILKGTSDATLRAFLRGAIEPFTVPTDARAWSRQAADRREDAIQNVYLRGFPPAALKGKPRVTWKETLRPHKDYSVRKLLIEVHDNYFIPALLYVPAKLGAKAPVMLNTCGHCSGGKAATHMQIRCANLARRGVYALNLEYIGMGELQADRYHDFQNALSFTGLSGVGLFYLAMSRGLDVLLDQPRADKTRVGVTGLSGGGWQTIVIASLDPRVTLTVPNAGYTTLKRRLDCDADLGDSEQTPTDMATALDYDHMTAMLAPKPTLQLMNQNDECCFRTDRIKPVVYDAMKPVWKLMGSEENLRFHSNTDPGTHNYGADHRSQLYKFLNEHWRLGAPEHDLHGADELLTELGASVGLPAAHQPIMTLARNRAVKLRQSRKAVKTVSQKEALRQRLAQTLRLPDYTLAPTLGVSHSKARNMVARLGKLDVPLTIVPGKDQGEVNLVIAESGRAARQPMPFPNQYPRIHADILGTGENKTHHLLKLAIDSVGHRTLGIMTAQTISLAESIAQGSRVVHAFASGTQPSVALCLAAAIAPQHFASVTAWDMPLSLEYLLNWPVSFVDVQAVFCFGLLEVADTADLLAMMDGVEYRAPGRELIPTPGGAA